MSKSPEIPGFGKYVPGFDFLQQLAQGGAASMVQWVAPTLDAQALDKRIEELKAVQFWLDQNAAALKATLQALEVQKMTLATLRSMNVPMPAAAPDAKAAPKARPKAQAEAPQAAAMPDPMQFWSALTTQFQQIAAGAMKEAAASAAPTSAASPAAKGAAAKGRTAPRNSPAARRPKD